MNEWLRGERHWGEFWELKEQLSFGSEFFAAQLEDQELAEQAADLPEPPPAPPSMRGYSPLLRKLDDVLDAIRGLHGATVGANPGDITPVERPKPRVELVRRERASAVLGSVTRLLLRGNGGQ